jgi:hypothetical protein
MASPRRCEVERGPPDRRLCEGLFDGLQHARQLGRQLLGLFVVRERAREHEADEERAAREHERHVREVDPPFESEHALDDELEDERSAHVWQRREEESPLQHPAASLPDPRAVPTFIGELRASRPARLRRAPLDCVALRRAAFNDVAKLCWGSN